MDMRLLWSNGGKIEQVFVGTHGKSRRSRVGTRDEIGNMRVGTYSEIGNVRVRTHGEIGRVRMRDTTTQSGAVRRGQRKMRAEDGGFRGSALVGGSAGSLRGLVALLFRRLRWFGAFVGVGLLCFGVGCQPTLVREKPPVSVWKAPLRVQILRGLWTGDSPARVQEVLCKQWLIGPCMRLQRLFSSLEKSGPQIFLYEDNQGPYPCHHRFFFGSWGLQKISTSCQTRTKAHTQALFRRYQRWLGPASRQAEESAVFQWAGEKYAGLSHSLHIKESLILTEHQDLRMNWLFFLRHIEPQRDLVSSDSWARWSRVDPSIQREVLRNLGRFLYALEARIGVERVMFRLVDGAWTQKQVTACVQKDQRTEDWNEGIWKQCGFVPDTPSALRYRFRWEVDAQQRRPSLFFRRPHLPFVFEAEGCGVRFRLRGARMDGGFENLQGYQLKRIDTEVLK